jgi:O-antigen/teichoic acid export membrane protein
LALPLAEVYGQPGLAGVLATLALLPLIQSLRSPGQPMLRRSLNYRAVALDEVGQTFVGVVVTVMTAILFHSVWALVAGTLAGAATGVLISYIQCPVRPVFVWDRTAGHRLLNVSKQVFINTFLMALLLNSDRLLGLSLVTVEQMGLYAVAWNLAGVLEILLSRACDVYFSALSRQGDPVLRAVMHEKVCFRMALILMPAMAFGIVAAPWLIRLLYDTRYAGAGVLFALLFARLMLKCLGQIQFQYLLSRAEIRVATVSYGTALIAQAVLMMPLALHWGALGLAISAFASTAVLVMVQSTILWFRGEIKPLPLFLTLGWTLTGLVMLSCFV